MDQLAKSFPIGQRKIGAGNPCFIIAEAGSNHNRNLDLAFQLIDAAVAAKADAVKFQTFSADTIVSQAALELTRMDSGDYRTAYELFKNIELPRSWQKELHDYAKSKGICFLSTPFDEAAINELEMIGIPAFKIASFELNHFPLLRQAAQCGKPVLLSTGMATLGEIEEALEVLDANGCRQVGLFHCGVGYPMEPASVNLRAMDTMAAAFQCPVGYSDHTLGIAVPVAAAARGAKMIEKHFTLKRNLPGPDHAFALEPDELAAMVSSIRIVEAALGSPLKKPAACEHLYLDRGRRSIFAAEKIPANVVIEKSMLAILRPGAGLHPRYMDFIAGRKATRDIHPNEPIRWEHIGSP